MLFSFFFFFLSKSTESSLCQKKKNISTLLKILLLASDKNAIKLAEGTKRGGGRNLLVQVIGKYRVVRLQAGLQPGDNVIRSLSLSTLCLVLH